VRLARLDRAATLLARSNYSVAEIARMCGFGDAFHFSRRFKAAYGQSPLQMRRALQNGATPPLSPLTRTFRASISDI
jgi:transcriptional regulator GlxA family with amidase domain